MSQEEKKLVEDAKNDPERFAALYDKHFDAIYRYVARRVSDREVAADLVSQTFYDALSHIQGFEWRGVSFAAWLYKIAHNNVLKWYRDGNKVAGLDIEQESRLADEGEDVVERLKKKEVRGDVEEALEKLEMEDREILRLKFFEEVSNIEIAEIMGLSANHIGVKVFRALQKMKQFLNP